MTDQRWHEAAARSLDAMYQRAVKAEGEAERLREALIQMDEAVCHGNPETAKRIAREAMAPRKP
jgi:hypothetical protein